MKGLTPLRGIAALAVLLVHAGVPFHGYLGVDLFFILSGFVLMHAYGEIEPRRGYWSFLKARLARIYPVHLVVLALLLPAFGRSGFGLHGLLASLFLMQSPWYHRCWNFVSWSISAEWHAYLVFPFIAVLLRPRSKAALIALLCACGVGIVVFQYAAPKANVTDTPWILWRLLPEFVAGMVLYRIRAARLIGSDGMVVTGAVAIIALQIFGVGDAATILVMPLLLLGAANDETRFARILDWRPLRYLGEISYSVYMIQMWVQIVTLTLLQELFPALPNWIANAAFVPLTILLAIPLSRFVEYPARDWIKRLAWPRAASRPAPTTDAVA
ncbi:MAG: acyltransferase family protein [Stellaceae bacterium]